MRRMAYVAATAAGLVAPLAFVAPASAAPAHSQLDLPIVGDLLDGSTPQGFNPNGGDYRDHDTDYSDNGAGNVTVRASEPDRDGNVSFIVEGQDLPPLMNLTLSSPGLDAACVGGNSVDGATVRTDLSGDFNVGATGTTCLDGTYQVDASEQSTPFETFSADVTVDSGDDY